jgi:penicillin-binding protein 1A
MDKWVRITASAHKYFLILCKYFIAARKPLYVKLLRWLSGSVGILVVYIFAIQSNFLWLFGSFPSISEIKNPEPFVASQVFSSDGKLLGKFFYENRVPVKYSEISPALINALLATEDERFYKHHGIDLKGLISAAFDCVRGRPRGASTITQQLVKNLYKTRSNSNHGLLGLVPFVRMLIIKSKEWICALEIEMYMSKEQILTLYLNTVDFGSNAFGIKTAARTYFGVAPQDLKTEECALLVGMLKATTVYNPVSNKKRSRIRRNIVLRNMCRLGAISAAQSDSLQKLPVRLSYRVEKIYDGSAEYFRAAVIDHLKPWLKKNKLDIYSDGLKIYTTIDSRFQDYAEKAVSSNMKRLQSVFNEHWQGRNPWVDEKDREIPGFIEMVLKQSWDYTLLKNRFADMADSLEYYVNKKERRTIFSWKGPIDTLISLRELVKYNSRLLHAGFVALDPSTGAVKAWVGGIDYDYFKFDNVNQSRRQPGSTFKTFVYTAALDNGFSPCDSLEDKPVILNYTENGEQKSWSPHNADWTFLNKNVTLKYAFARSLNTITVQITRKIGWKKVIEYATKMGINSPLDTVPSICLGSADVSLLELVDAYCPIANGGYRVEPMLVTRIEDRNGNVLLENSPSKTRVLSDKTVFLMQQMFLGTMNEPLGTTQALFQFDLFRYGIDFGGKTGTSSNNSDGWFVGVTPSLVSGAWVGGEQRCIHFRTSELGEGCKTALPIYGLFMEKVVRDTAFKALHTKFSKYGGSIPAVSYCCHTEYVPSDTVDSLQVKDEYMDKDEKKTEKLGMQMEGDKAGKHGKVSNDLNVNRIKEEEKKVRHRWRLFKFLNK